MRLKRCLMMTYLILSIAVINFGQTATTPTPEVEKTPEVVFVRKTADRASIVKIDGIEHKALTVNQLRQIQLDLTELQSARKQLDIYSKYVSETKSEIESTKELISIYQAKITNLEKQLKIKTELIEIEQAKADKKKEIRTNEKISDKLWLVDNPISRFILKILRWIL